ncbi:Uncharacterised protein [Legionella busanensis]|uniref:Uncharacterized protein n=1 Tax=Legionella busanensis TaxID=190655 RepID=A0A378JPD9_9GAMM|nr:hypothetical protein [Legionella busanensis]STX52059.1 Uncharacterised protein [Legionella busanensis]
MSKLKTELNSFIDKLDKLDFMSECFARLKEKVDEVLLFGKANSPIAERVVSLYCTNSNNNKNQFFPVNHSRKELDVLPAVIADSLRFFDKEQRNLQKIIEPFSLYSKYFEDAYLYGTGTCENYAIVGAYFLMAEFDDIELSIETLNSDQSHTYIRVHTTPEYVFDFWGDFLCEYTDTPTWNECVGELYPRNDKSHTKINITFSNREQLINLGEDIFSKKNEEQRLKIINQVEILLDKEYQFDKNISKNCDVR